MKIRTGFVSNSSSSSFMARGVKYSFVEWNKKCPRYSLKEIPKFEEGLTEFIKEIKVENHIIYACDYCNQVIYFGKILMSDDSRSGLLESSHFNWFKESVKFKRIMAKYFSDRPIMLFFGEVERG